MEGSEVLEVVARIVCFGAGAFLVYITGQAAIRTVVVPRPEPVWLSTFVFVSVRKLFDRLAPERKPYEQRDKVMARYAPTALILLVFTWVVLVIAGFTLMFWGAVAEDSWSDAFYLSGASLTTLGSFSKADVTAEVLSFIEATIGLGLVALLISYLPSIYAAFQRRELAVTMLETRAGSPPSALELIERHSLLARLDAIEDLWPQWEEWFADIEETHTSQPALVFFRSPLAGRSWVTSAGVVLDTAALKLSVLDGPRDPQAALCIRAGFLSLRRIADFFGIPNPLAPAPTDPISITRREFDLACTRMEAAGVPLREDREQAWRDFAGWRVNYDAALIGLAGLVMAPWALWSADRAEPFRVRMGRFGKQRKVRS